MRQYGIVNTSFHAILWMVHFISVFPFLNDLDCKMSGGFHVKTAVVPVIILNYFVMKTTTL